jgi:hypothetical protein
MTSDMMKPAAALALILLAACARTEDAGVRAPESNDSNRIAEQVRPPAADPQEPALGEWRLGLQQERQALEFGPAGTTPLVTVVCGDRGGFVLERPGVLPPGAAPSLGIAIAGGQPRRLPLTTGTGATAVQSATIPAGDPLLQQLAAAQGPIALRFGDGTPLVLPQSPLIGQFAGSCNNGRPIAGAPEANGQAPAADNAAAANATEGAGGR